MIVGITISNSQVYFLGFFFFEKHFLQFVGNESIYSLGKDLVKQNTIFYQTKCFTRTLQVGLTRETLAKTSS